MEKFRAFVFFGVRFERRAFAIDFAVMWIRGIVVVIKGALGHPIRLSKIPSWRGGEEIHSPGWTWW
jgi:hypothetical protein